MTKKKLTYESPVDREGQNYWVPVVVKNKDTLIGMIEGVNFVLNTYELPDDLQNILLGSDRFNDRLPDGRCIHDLNDNQFREYLKDIIINEYSEENNHPDNCDVDMDYLLDVDCSCGNFHGFNSVEEIPSESVYCDLCGRIIIHYTGHDDSEYQFNGSTRDVTELVASIKQELGIEEDDADEEEGDDF